MSQIRVKTSNSRLTAALFGLLEETSGFDENKSLLQVRLVVDSETSQSQHTNQTETSPSQWRVPVKTLTRHWEVEVHIKTPTRPRQIQLQASTRLRQVAYDESKSKNPQDRNESES